MPIPYPLAIPSGGSFNTPGPSKANLKKYDAVGEVTSPFSGSAQQQAWQDLHWELELQWPEMSADQFAPLDAFSGALHGKLGTLLWGPPLSTVPRGSANGVPICGGSDLAGSNVLNTVAWMPSQSGVLLPGDYLSLGGRSLLQQVSPQRYIVVGILQTVNTFFSVTAGVLTVNLPRAWSAGQLASLPGKLVQFLGLSDPSNVWVNGLNLTVISVVNIGPGGASGQFTARVSQPDYPTTFEPTGTVSLNPPSRLYQYVNPNPLNTDGGGNAPIDIFPNLREAPTAGDPLLLQFPQGTFRLADNRREAPADKNKTFTFQLKCREAI